MAFLSELQSNLKKIIDDYPMSYAQYAKMIGVTEHTLLFFLKGDREPRRLTRWKIERFIKKQEEK